MNAYSVVYATIRVLLTKRNHPDLSAAVDVYGEWVDAAGNSKSDETTLGMSRLT